VGGVRQSSEGHACHARGSRRHDPTAVPRTRQARPSEGRSDAFIVPVSAGHACHARGSRRHDPTAVPRTRQARPSEGRSDAFIVPVSEGHACHARGSRMHDPTAVPRTRQVRPSERRNRKSPDKQNADTRQRRTDIDLTMSPESQRIGSPLDFSGFVAVKGHFSTGSMRISIVPC
jgi:hypothetical protein